MNTQAAQPVVRTVALIYVRQSRTDPEDKNNYSPETQRFAALARPELAGLRHEIYEDLNRSGGSVVGRAQYQQLLSRLDDGDVQYVVCYDLSRLTRDLGDQQELFNRARRCGVKVIDALKGMVFDAGKAGDMLIAGMFGVVNQYQRSETAARIRGVLATKAAKGDLVGPLPAGYKHDRDINPVNGKVTRVWVVVDEEPAEVVRTIFREYATGTYSFKSLARWLNARGTGPPQHHDVGRGARPAGSPEHALIFTADSIKDIVRNPRYAGRVPLQDGRTVQGIYPTLVDVATFDTCERIRASRRFMMKREPGAGKGRSRYLLSGLLRCARCDSTMSGHTRTPDRTHPQRRHSYTCYRRRIAGGCDAPAVLQDVVEAELVAVLRTMALPPGFARAVDRAVAARLRTPERDRAISPQALASRMKRLNDLYEWGKIDADEFARKSGEIEEQRVRPPEKPAPLFIQQQQVLRTLVDDWGRLADDERRRMLAAIFDSVKASAEGIDRLEPSEDWRPYVEAAFSRSVRVPTERKTGFEPATPTLAT